MWTLIRGLSFEYFITFVAICLAFSTSHAKEVPSARDKLESITKELVSRIPLEKSVALKLPSPEKSGLPQDFLLRLSSDLEASLLKSSEFRINLQNRLKTEDIWQDAIEFNNTDFAKLYEASKSQYLVFAVPRLTTTSVELTISVYELDGEMTGRVVYSSGAIDLEIDAKTLLGIDLNTVDKKLDQILADIKRLSQTGGLIDNPQSFAELYHNARVLEVRGDAVRAIASYDAAIRKEADFVDPAINMTNLLVREYGTNGAVKYIQNRIAPRVNRNLLLVMYAVLDQDLDITIENLVYGIELFPPATAIWLKRNAQLIEDNKKLDEQGDTAVRYALLTLYRNVIHSYEKGDFQKHFIDNSLAVTTADIQLLKAKEEQLNRVEFRIERVWHVPGTSRKMLIDLSEVVTNTKLTKNYFQRFKREDDSDLGDIPGRTCPYPLEFCWKQAGEIRWPDDCTVSGGNIKCRPPDELPTTFPNAQSKTFSDDLPLPWETQEFLKKYDKSKEAAYSAEQGFEDHFVEKGYPKEQLPIRALHSPVTTITDRLLLGDILLGSYADEKSRQNGFQIKPFEESTVISHLVITDDVDKTKPIKFFYEICWEGCGLFSVDIRDDGSYVMPTGAVIADQKYTPNDEKEIGIWYSNINSWYFVPGFVQSTLGLFNFGAARFDIEEARRNSKSISIPPDKMGHPIKFVQYTDTTGRQKTVTNIKVFQESRERIRDEYGYFYNVSLSYPDETLVCSPAFKTIQELAQEVLRNLSDRTPVEFTMIENGLNIRAALTRACRFEELTGLAAGYFIKLAQIYQINNAAIIDLTTKSLSFPNIDIDPPSGEHEFDFVRKQNNSKRSLEASPKNESGANVEEARDSRPILFSTIEGWQIFDGRHVNGQCFALGNFTNNRRFAISRETSGTWSAGIYDPSWRQFKLNRGYDLQFYFDRGGRWKGPAKAVEGGLVLDPINDRFVEDIAASRGLRIVYKNREIARFGLRGTRAATETVYLCSAGRQ